MTIRIHIQLSPVSHRTCMTDSSTSSSYCFIHIHRFRQAVLQYKMARRPVFQLFMFVLLTVSLTTFLMMQSSIQIYSHKSLNAHLESSSSILENNTATALLPACPREQAKSEKFKVSYKLLSFTNITKHHGKDFEFGGHFRPCTCQADQKVAIIVPYRDRENNLKLLLNNLHPFLKKQDIEYTIFVAEQLAGTKFNRGMIKNIGFAEARKLYKFDCVFFHDIDMTPDDFRNVYHCGDQPRLHSRKLPRWHYKPFFDSNFGGVVSMKTDQFIRVNGYSNSFFQWGCEDDELKLRFKYHNITTSTYPFDISSYQEFEHRQHPRPSKESKQWYKKWRSRLKNDGLTTLFYDLEAIQYHRLYTHIYVSVNMTAVNIAYEGRLGGLS